MVIVPQASSVVFVLAPSLLFLCIFRVIQKYLQAKRYNIISMVLCVAIADGINILGELRQ